MCAQQLHIRFTTDQVKAIVAKYSAGELSAKQARTYLAVSKSRFYQLIEEYEQDPTSFSIEYLRTKTTRGLKPIIERNILKELAIEKEKIVDNPLVPTKRYNYSYLKGQIKKKYQQEVSLPAIIKRAKEHGYWKPKPPKKIHDRQVITNYVGELIQHDSSHHLWAPDGGEKWYLITSIDDYSRAILYAEFVLRETTWTHIVATESLCLRYGFPFSYYADQHRIFRYVKDRDKNSPFRTFVKFTDDVDPQWKQVLKDCGVQTIYALSPQAKGKVERPYEWLQDHIVRTCVREGIKRIADGRKALQEEVRQYNEKRIHSTTKEIPLIRFRRSISEQKTLFRPFAIPSPFQSAKDVFCLRIARRVDAYRRVSIQGLELSVPNVLPKEEIELRLYPDLKLGFTEVRFWHRQQFKGFQRIKNEEMPIVQF